MACGHKAFTKSRPKRRTNVKIWVEVYAKVECSTKRREGRVEGRHAETTLQDKDELKDDIQRRPQHQHTQTRPILVLPRKKRPFVEIFHPTIWNCRFFAIYLQHRKTPTNTLIHTFIHTIECFSSNEIFIKQRASST